MPEGLGRFNDTPALRQGLPYGPRQAPLPVFESNRQIATCHAWDRRRPWRQVLRGKGPPGDRKTPETPAKQGQQRAIARQT